MIHISKFLNKFYNLKGIKIVLGLAMLIGMIMSWKLWISSRLYPLTPISSKLPTIGFPFDYIIFGILIILLLLIIIFRQPLKVIILFVVLASLWSILDQSRWQPWFYQYLIMFSVLAYYYWDKDNNERKHFTTYILRIIIATIYFWSGVHHLNPTFINKVVIALLEPFIGNSFILPQEISQGIAISMSLIEILIGIGLLSRNYWKLSAILGIIMHIIILIIVGPFGFNLQTIIWPWNIAMILFLVILMKSINNFSMREFLNFKKFKILSVLVIIFILLPSLSFVNMWDSFLSWSLFSGNTHRPETILSDNAVGKIPDYMYKYIITLNGRNIISFREWSFDELNVPQYRQPRIFKNNALHLCKYLDNPNDLKLTIRDKWQVFKDPISLSYNCKQLEELKD